MFFTYPVITLNVELNEIDYPMNFIKKRKIHSKKTFYKRFLKQERCQEEQQEDQQEEQQEGTTTEVLAEQEPLLEMNRNKNKNTTNHPMKI